MGVSTTLFAVPTEVQRGRCIAMVVLQDSVQVAQIVATFGHDVMPFPRRFSCDEIRNVMVVPSGRFGPSVLILFPGYVTKKIPRGV